MKLRSRRFKEYGTHIPMVIKMILETKGRVMEMGVGFFSTPNIHWLCAKDKRVCYSFESDPEYHQFARQFRSPRHKIRLVKDWDKADFSGKWSVALVDHETERRAKDALRIKDNCEFVILHDTEGEVYGYDEVYKQFKYRYDWKDCRPWTTVLSNFKPIPYEYKDKR